MKKILLVFLMLFCTCSYGEEITVEVSDNSELREQIRLYELGVSFTSSIMKLPLLLKYHIVAHGDTLHSIAFANNITIDTLIGCNRLKFTRSLVAGTILRIPNQEGLFYVLKDGETADILCERYGISKDLLKFVNSDIDISYLVVGDEVFIPTANPLRIGEERE